MAWLHDLYGLTVGAHTTVCTICVYNLAIPVYMHIYIYNIDPGKPAAEVSQT